MLTLLSIPVAVLWAYASKILSWCVQDPEIATAAGSYVRWLIPSLFVFVQCSAMSVSCRCRGSSCR